ncbi:hypothetical protein Hanom_Chr15g01412611 [Helianthus anomalus]
MDHGIEKRIENYSSGPEDDSEMTTRSVTGGNQRKLHRVWTFFGSKEVVHVDNGIVPGVTMSLAKGAPYFQG